MSDLDTRRRERIADDSDHLLETVDKIRQMEREKRGEEISTPRFHELADEIEDRARDVFRYAHDERDTGDDVTHRQGRTIEDVEQERD